MSDEQAGWSAQARAARRKHLHSTVCAVCDGSNFRACGCPWLLPFHEWPARLLVELRGLPWPS
jgi:hypothetical protein